MPDVPGVPSAEDLVARYRELAASGLAANVYRGTVTASGGCWRTLQGLADFAITQSYLSTAKWGISTLDALRDLFNGRAWIRPASNPPDSTASRNSCHITSRR